MVLRRLLPLLLLVFMDAVAAQSLPQRFLQLLGAQGVSGHETDAAMAIRAQLPAWCKPQKDEIGNLFVSFGQGAPHRVLVAVLDEPGYLVSRITDDGFLRLHRHTTGPAGIAMPLRDQFMVGQPVMIRTSSGKQVAGVTATPSTHLSRLTAPGEAARIKDLNDLWVDVGATNPAAVEKLGIRMLDPVNLRERAQPLASGRVAGVAAQLRAGAQSLVELLRSLPGEPAVAGKVTIAWVTQSQFGGRGLARLAKEIQPQNLLFVGRSAPAAGANPLLPGLPAAWKQLPYEAKAVPVLFADTPVELIDTHDISALAGELAADLGLAPAAADGAHATVPAMFVAPAALPAAIVPSAGAFATLKSLIEAYGVSGNEGPVRDSVLKRLPAWTRPEVDAKGNISVSFGHGGKALMFVAHLDEVGFEITAIRDDGSAAIKVRGGVFLSLYEAHPVMVQTPGGNLPAVIAPRNGYAVATRGQPEINELSLQFGTVNADATRALGVSEGQKLTVRKSFVDLAAPRATGRSMDDRAGVSAMLLAIGQLDPARVANRVTFAWSVEEETGLDGAIALAARFHPDVAFAIDTFVSTDTPLDVQYLAHAPLGGGAVLRGADSRSLVPAASIDRIVALAAKNHLPLQIGVTQGGTDASVFAADGAIDIGLSWPGRYSHSPVEVIDRRDLDTLVKLVALLAREY